MTKPVINSSNNGYPVKIVTPEVNENKDWEGIWAILSRAIGDRNKIINGIDAPTRASRLEQPRVIKNKESGS